MSARADINRCLQQWLELMQAEAGAIQSAAWPELDKIHGAKTALQKSLDAAREKLSRENGTISPTLQKQIAHLISLEGRNADLLAAQQRRAQAEQTILDQSRRTLRKIRRSYTPDRKQIEWQCYS